MQTFESGGLKGRIRAMESPDVAEVMKIETSSYYSPWSEHYFRHCLRSGFQCWVYEEEDRVEAYAIMSLSSGYGHIMNLCVRRSARRQGLGKMLLCRLIEIARESASTAMLEVRLSNQVAIDLYESMGFEKVGVRHNYYPSKEGREDALLLSLRL